MASDQSNQDILSAALDDAGLGEFLSSDFSVDDADDPTITSPPSVPITPTQVVQSSISHQPQFTRIAVPISNLVRTSSPLVTVAQTNHVIKTTTGRSIVIPSIPSGSQSAFSNTQVIRGQINGKGVIIIKKIPSTTVSTPTTSSLPPSSSVSSVTLPILQSQTSASTVKSVLRQSSEVSPKATSRTGSPEVSLLAPKTPTPPEDEVDFVDEEEDHFQADTYSDYMPSQLKIGVRHPDPVVETASLSSVLPPKAWYKLSIPEEIIDEGKLSALQLEAITYACQQHETFLKDGSRAGFLLGDGPGVGKGRTLAGIIYENYLLDRKRSIWLSVSNDLRYDAERDLRDIGAKKIAIYPLNKCKYGKISSKDAAGLKKGVLFATYSSLIGESHITTNKYRTRLKQILNWCGEDFDGVIIFDECHKAKNLCPAGSTRPTKTGLTVLELQKRLPKARIVYASATGASEPKNMAYMVRLGLWGPGTAFKEFSDFVTTVEKRGVGAMELVAIDMKLRGVYIARQLSFAGVQFKIEEINLSKKFINLYDDCVKIWVDAKNKIDKALELMEDDNHIKKAVWGQFWAAHQRFFKYLCIAAKVKRAVTLGREAVKDDKCVVIGLQSTGEAKTLETLEESGGELSDFVSTAKAVFQTMIEKHFPAPNRRKTLQLLSRGSSFMDDQTSSLSDYPLNPVDQILKKYESTESESRPQKSSQKKGLWSMSDSEGSVFGSDSDEDFESVSEGDDIDSMWDAFASGQAKKAKKRSKKKKTGKSNGNTKKVKREKRDTFDELLSVKAEFMSDEALELCEKMRDSLLEQIEALDNRLPPNTLDELIDELGGVDSVAEMTGRKGRVISNDSGSVQYESRTENDVALEILNVTEKQRFMDGDKKIAIISEAASSGISLHSDKRAKNRRRRVHLTIELPWSADRAIQQFGRTHRSNQANAPEYIFLISDLAGEQRFASIVAKRLESLGALTHGDRRATESRDLSKFNIDNKYGRQSLEIIMKSLVGQERPLVDPPTGFVNFFKEAREAFINVGLITKVDDVFVLDKDYNVISKFLNRLLGIEVYLQNAIFQYFSETLEAVVKQAKRLGRYDIGIIDLTSDIAKIERKNHQVFYHKHSTGAAKIELHQVAVERGMAWDDAHSLWSHCKTLEEGFYLVNPDADEKKKTIFLAVIDSSSKTFTKQVFRIYRPNTGLQSKTETASSLKEGKTKKILPEEAESVWKRIYDDSDTMCNHQIRGGRCTRKSSGLTCDVGLRKRIFHILSGSILSLWETIEKTLPSNMQSKLQMARLKTADGLRVIGTLVPEKAVPILVEKLSDKPSESVSVKDEKQEKPPTPKSPLEEKDSDSDDDNTPAPSVPILSTH